MAIKIWQGKEGTDVSKGGNWSSGTIPANGDSIVVPSDASVNMAGDLDSLAAVTLMGFTVEDGCSINIGVREGNTLEYFEIELLHSAAYYNATLGGTGEIYLRADNYHEITIRMAGAAPGTGRSALNLIGTQAADLTDGRGSIHVQAATGAVALGNQRSTAQNMELNKLHMAAVATGVTVVVDASSEDYSDTSIPFEVEAGIVKIFCPMESLAQSGGTVYTEGDAANTASTITGGTFYGNSDGTIAALNASGSAIVSFDGNLRARTVSNCILAAGATLRDKLGLVTFTNGIDLIRCGLDDVTLDWGSHRTITPSTV